MPRAKRIQFEGAWYHVFNRGINKKTIAFSHKHYGFFLDLLHIISDKFDIEIHSYCLMKNHYHLLIKTPEANLSKAMQYFGSCFSRIVNDDMNADGAVFKDRFKSILVDSDAYLLQLSRYIHLNPVKAGLCCFPEQYEWSSYPYFFNEQDKPGFLYTKDILGLVRCNEDYKYFINLGVDDKLNRFYNQRNIPSVLGDRTFKEKVSKYKS